MSPPFTSSDLYGTGGNRLQRLAEVNGELAKRFIAEGNVDFAKCWAKEAGHFGYLALLGGY